MALSLRADKKVVQGTYFKIALSHRLAEVMEERGVEKLSKADVELISEALEASLYGRALPQVSTTELAWDIHSGEVLAFSTSENKLEMVRQWMKETFGVVLRPERMVDWVADKLDWTEVCDRVGDHLPGPPPKADGPTLDGYHEDDPLEPHAMNLASDFLTWLWLQSEASDGLFRVIDGSGAQAAALDKLTEVDEAEVDDEWNDITESLRHSDLTVWIDQRMTLQELDEDAPETTILIGQSPSSSAEARHNLERGKRPVEVKLGLKLNDLECMMVVAATPGGIVVKGLKVPTVVKDGTDERLLERMFLADLVHTTVKQLFQQFFMVRTSPAWHPRVDRWITQDLAAAK